MGIIFSVSQYFLSFMPLWVAIIFIQVRSILSQSDSLYCEWISLICILLMTVFATIVLRKGLRNNDTSTHECYLVEVKEEKGKSLEYLLTYILPLSAFDFTTWDGMTLYLLFFLIMGFLSIKHQYFLINIPLEVLGFNTYLCDYKDESGIELQATIIYRGNLKVMENNSINAKYINNQYMYAR